LDPFSAQKEAALTHSLQAVIALASYMLDITANGVDSDNTNDQFSALFHVRWHTVYICINSALLRVKWQKLRTLYYAVVQWFTEFL